MKLFRTTDSPSWPALIADCPLKIGTNSIRDMTRTGRIVCRLHAPADRPELAALYAELSLAELARLARLHAEIVAVLGDKDARRDSGADDGGGSLDGLGGGTPI